jgi:hypothetical protein
MTTSSLMWRDKDDSRREYQLTNDRVSEQRSVTAATQKNVMPISSLKRSRTLYRQARQKP